MEKRLENNLKKDGFVFIENEVIDGILTVNKGDFNAYWVYETSTGRMPKFSECSDGSLFVDGTFKTHDYVTFLNAIVTNEIDFVEYYK